MAALKASLKPKATCKRNGVWAEMDATMIVPGDLVLLAAGSAVPADSWVNHGEVEVDQSAMTGASPPPLIGLLVPSTHAHAHAHTHTP